MSTGRVVFFKDHGPPFEIEEYLVRDPEPRGSRWRTQARVDGQVIRSRRFWRE